MRLTIRNGSVLNTLTMTYSEQTVVCESGTIVAVGDDNAHGDVEIDARGAYVLPGLIDAHVHFRLATLDFRALTSWTEVEFGIAMARLSEATVRRGFTTVRDLGGDLTGLLSAIRRGVETHGVAK